MQSARIKRLYHRKDLGRVGIGLDLFHHMCDDAVLVDDKGGAHDTKVDLAVELLFLPDAKGLDGHTVGVGEKNEGQGGEFRRDLQRLWELSSMHPL